jgi:Domain of unknown function (DUF4333)
MSSPVRPVALALAVSAIAVIGCGGTVIDDSKTEGAIQHNLEASLKEKVSGVECPSGVEVKAGTTFECTVKLADGTQEAATLKIVNKDADVELVDLSPAK